VISKFKHEILWKKNEPELIRRAVAFWDAEAEKDNSSRIQGREQDIVLMSFDEHDNVNGVLMAEKKYSEKLGCNMFYTTARLNPDRHRGVTRKVLRETAFHCLQSYNESLPEPDRCSGIIMEIETVSARKEKRPAEWGGYIYFGLSESGLPARVRYFDAATVGPWM
jgi:hypothetical protein